MKTLIMLKDTFIFLKDMMAYENGGDKTTLDVDSDDTMYSVMAQVEEMTDVPPALQMLTFEDKSFYHDTPGTLAENKLVPTTYPDPILVEYTDASKLVDYVLQRNTLRGLGFRVGDDLFPDASTMLQLVRSHGQKMMISLTDYIRKDGAGKKMKLVVEPGDTVASLKEQVQRRRRYPPAMQEISVSDADDPYNGRRMDRLDATLADYNVKKNSVINLVMSSAFAIQSDREERGKVVNEAEEIAEQQQRRPAPRVGETMMQMLVHDVLTGKRRVLWVDPNNDTVYSVMAQIEDATGVPPILQRILNNCKCFYYDTPGSLAENKVAVYVSPHHLAFVTVTSCTSGWHRLQSKTLRNLGFDVDDRSVERQANDDPAGHKERMSITVTDYIRMDGADYREMWTSAFAEDTVRSLMERLQRRRRYPVAMQQLWVSGAGCPDMERRMDKLDATLADYNVKWDSLIKLRMNNEFAWQAHMERGARKANKAKEIAAATGEPATTKKSEDPARSVYKYFFF